MSLAPADDDDGFVAGVMSLAPADDDDGFVAGVMSLAPADDDDGFVAGVMSLAPADDDDGFDAAGVLVDVVALALAADPLFLGLAEDVRRLGGGRRRRRRTPRKRRRTLTARRGRAECVGAGVQVGFGVAPTPLLPGPAELVLVLVVGLAGGVEVAVECRSGPGWDSRSGWCSGWWRDWCWDSWCFRCFGSRWTT